MIEVLRLGEFDEVNSRREFDASNGDGGWNGMLSYEDDWNPPRVYVFVDRSDPLGDSHACRPGRLEEVTDDTLAREVIAGALAKMPYRPRGVWSSTGYAPLEGREPLVDEG